MNVAGVGGRAEELSVAAIETPVANTATAGRLAGMDMLKGLLLLFVIVGHFPNIPVEASYLKQVIYSFHMPVFIIVTGTLFNVEKWSGASLWSFFEFCLKRLLVPWAKTMFPL